MITLINKSDSVGGAAVACYRLFRALKWARAEVAFLVQEATRGDMDVVSTTNTKLKSYINFFRFVVERLYFLRHEKSKEIRFAFSPAVTGEDISSLPQIAASDVLHIHWFNQGFLSLADLNKLFAGNRKIVWTLHDMWAFTGGCHYAGECRNFEDGCRDCHFLSNPCGNDLSSRIFEKKKKLFAHKNIKFVTCSNWLMRVAKSSALLRDAEIFSIPNPIDTDIFNRKNKSDVRLKFNLPQNKKLVLFASANVRDKRKGLNYFIDALQHLKQNKADVADNLELVVLGKNTADLAELLPYTLHTIPYQTSEIEIAAVYSACDLFVLPSVEDNLPNTVMESLACGAPVVAFATGGIPEMVDHKANGYLAEYKSTSDLANGIYWCLFEADYARLSDNAINKVATNYTFEVVAKKYLAVYSSF